MAGEMPDAADWASLKELVDLDAFERVLVFLTARSEVIGWAQYKDYITRCSGWGFSNSKNATRAMA